MKKIVKNNLKIIIAFVVGIVISGTTVYAATTILGASQVSYDQTTVADALDSLYQTQFSNNYSTDEKIVGKWIDNKPLYQRTIDCGTLPNNGNKIITLFDDYTKQQIVSIDAYSIRNSDHGVQKLPYTGSDGSFTLTMGMFISEAPIGSGKTGLTIFTTSDRTNCHAYATIQYTKTDDQPITNN